MQESLISKITEEAVRKVTYHLQLQVDFLKLENDRTKQRLEQLEQQNQPKQAIGFHAKGSETTPELAFKSYRKYSGTHD